MPDDGGSGAALIVRMAAGDEAALGELYDLHAGRVYAAAFAVLGDRAAAEDVVEETFWQVWRTAATYSAGRAAVATWLLMIARSRALDRGRSDTRRVNRDAAAAEGDPPPTATSQPDVSEPHRRLAAGLESLSPDQRQAIELAFFEGLSHAEIAERTGTPLGTVKTRIRSALQVLRGLVNMRRGGTRQ